MARGRTRRSARGLDGFDNERVVIGVKEEGGGRTWLALALEPGLDGEHVGEVPLGDGAREEQAVALVAAVAVERRRGGGGVVVGMQDGEHGGHDAEPQEGVHEPRLGYDLPPGLGRRRLGVLVGQVSDLLVVLDGLEQCELLVGGERGAGRERTLLLRAVCCHRQQVGLEEEPRLGLVVDGHVLALGRDHGEPEGLGVHVVDDDLQLDALLVVLEDVVEERVDPDHAAEGSEVGQAGHDLGADHPVRQGAQGVELLLVGFDVGIDEFPVCAVHFREVGGLGEGFS
ncbi:hypothetical protein PG985_003288 [Apiospora marii]|uniref:Uncharacterized protein n=1 Tax=Apiospora marii TaxID=335849 RepID=A0ABR1RWF0_9PEZI